MDKMLLTEMASSSERSRRRLDMKYRRAMVSGDESFQIQTQGQSKGQSQSYNLNYNYDDSHQLTISDIPYLNGRTCNCITITKLDSNEKQLNLSGPNSNPHLNYDPNYSSMCSLCIQNNSNQKPNSESVVTAKSYRDPESKQKSKAKQIDVETEVNLQRSKGDVEMIKVPEVRRPKPKIMNPYICPWVNVVQPGFYVPVKKNLNQIQIQDSKFLLSLESTFGENYESLIMNSNDQENYQNQCLKSPNSKEASKRYRSWDNMCQCEHPLAKKKICRGREGSKKCEGKRIQNSHSESRRMCSENEKEMEIEAQVEGQKILLQHAQEIVKRFHQSGSGSEWRIGTGAGTETEIGAAAVFPAEVDRMHPNNSMENFHSGKMLQYSQRNDNINVVKQAEWKLDDRSNYTSLPSSKSSSPPSLSTSPKLVRYTKPVDRVHIVEQLKRLQNQDPNSNPKNPNPNQVQGGLLKSVGYSHLALVPHAKLSSPERFLKSKKKKHEQNRSEIIIVTDENEIVKEDHGVDVECEEIGRRSSRTGSNDSGCASHAVVSEAAKIKNRS